MGAYLSEPVTEKVSSDEANEKLECGASSMQGWRVTQEDAHNTILDFDTNTCLFAVYDGHGGSEVAMYCSQKLPDYIKNTEAYKNGDLVKALEEAFLGFDATIATKEIMAILKDMAGEMFPPRQSDDEESDDENVGNLYQEAQLPLQEVLAKYENKLGGIHRARLADAGTPLSPCLRGKRGDEAGGSGASASSSSGAGAAGSAASSSEPAPAGAAAAGRKGDATDEGVSSTNDGEADKEVNGEVSTSEPDNSKAMEVDKPTVPAPDSSEDNHLEPEQSEPKSASNGADCNGEVTESQRGDENITSSNGSAHGKGKAKDKSSPVSSSDKPIPDRPKKAKLSRMAAMVYETLLRRAQDDDEENDEDDENDETFQGDVNGHSSDEEANGAEDDESNCDEEEEDIEEEEPDSSEADSEDEASGREEPGMDSGCTAVVALLKDNELYVANAGDSRCIICREGRAVDMSVDHKPEDELELARVTKAGGKVSSDGRINSGLNLSRAIGDHSYKQNKELNDREQMITALPDVKTLTLQPDKDQFLVLACDGVWNFMSSQDVCDFILPRLREGRERLSQIAEEMFDHCLAPSTAGDGTGCDNMTAIIVRFKDGVVAEIGQARPKRAADDTAEQDSKRQKLTDDSIVTSSV